MKRSTIIVVFIFLALLVFTLIWQKNLKNDDITATASATPAAYLLAFDPSTLMEIQILNSQGRALTLIKDDTNSWLIAGNPNQQSDSTKVQTLINQLATMSILATLDSSVSASDLGINSPAYIIKLSSQNGVVQKVYMGNLTSIKSGYYVRLDGEKETHIITKNIMDSITKLVENPPLPPTSTPEVVGLPTTQP